ncbi:MAG: nucleotide sugar dehydrogenase [Nitrospirae bacterium]|nr:nucleotide sugar dehydrogenase [Nitrospirota bacterium]
MLEITFMHSLAEKIRNRQAHVAIIGMGYVGLPLAVEFAKSGFPVLGIDVDREKIAQINAGRSYIQDVSDTDLRAVLPKFQGTADFSRLVDVDAVIVCVPTPLRQTKDPDISYIVAATEEIKKYLHPKMLVVLESTTYPGTTDEILLPEMESTGLKIGQDFFLCFSPERIDPGNKSFNVRNTPKIVGGVTATCTEIGVALYQGVADKVIPVSSTRSAEMVKLLENTFRAVNIGLVNEVAIICDKLGMDVWEVIDAAATKPFGFMPFYPGPGLGGHCIPIDPHYLSWKLKMMNYNARFIELASEVNTNMPYYVANKVADALNRAKRSVNGSRILILGVAYKKDISDVRESPSLDVIRLLRDKGAEIAYHDPYVPVLDMSHHLTAGYAPGTKTADQLPLESVSMSGYAGLQDYDCVVIITNHSSFRYPEIVKHARLIVDTRNATQGIRSEKIVKL